MKGFSVTDETAFEPFFEVYETGYNEGWMLDAGLCGIDCKLRGTNVLWYIFHHHLPSLGVHVIGLIS